MGSLSQREALALRWTQILGDPALGDLPYKIELNAFGNIEMSPRPSTRHGRLQARVAVQLAKQLGEDGLATEIGIMTDLGVRVPDVLWGTNEFWDRNTNASPLPAAPQICVEIRSPSNSVEEMVLKTRAYLDAGAVEVWVIYEDGSLQIYAENGRCATCRWNVQLDLPLL